MTGITRSGPPACMVQLRAELVGAAARATERRHRKGRSVGVVLALVAAIGALVVSRPAPALADIRVELRGDRIAVLLTDLEHRPREIEAVLRGLGLDASVVAAPVGPSQVGRFVGSTDAAGLAPELVRLDATDATFAGFTVPIGWSGPLELHVGRPARADEPYAVFSDALAPGEPLACRALLGRRLDVVGSALERAGLNAMYELGPAARPVPAGDATLRGHSHWVVRSVSATSASSVVVRLDATRGSASTSPACGP